MNYIGSCTKCHPFVWKNRRRHAERLLLHAAQSKQLEAFATRHRLTGPVVDRYVAGYTVEDAGLRPQLKAEGLDVSLIFLVNLCKTSAFA